ncbi:hypothetical protein CANMA_000172 [Candida margitis]|uniref:uncharacterized protein n=1 Tax=Candida margitis TaxID=1775924 RepID=UPI002227FC7A|nr:uncharacterized protein CANMA_000172 [Candida margitis]KAI5970753.1 hypothetical protein CANMA_000172 [Candida margitis]
MPNFILCLSHFCELHGPQIIVCTQVTTNDKKQDYLASNSNQGVCASCQLILPDNAASLVTNCDSTVFISTAYPSSQRRYAALKKLMMKSLSVETVSDITKPMFFGDAIHGYCLNKIFKIDDINARGQERKYSLMMVCDSEADLLQNWDILTLYMCEFIDLIQQRVLQYTNEKMHRLSGGSVVDNEKYLRRSMTRPKSLIELTDDPRIFVKFHIWAVEALKDTLQ